MDRYILIGKIPSKEPDILKWGEWMERSDRHIGNDMIRDNIQISTVFLGLDHNWSGGNPILFETMIFGGLHDGYQERYYSWEEAEIGHKEALKLVTGDLN